MKTFFGSLYHAFDMANNTQMLWCGGILLIILALAILHHFWKDDTKKIRIWRFLCLTPVMVSVVHFVIYVVGFYELAGDYTLMYVIAMLPLLTIPFAKRKIGYRISATLTGVLSVACGLLFSVTAPHCYNYTQMSYTESFHALVQKMDSTYVLKDWKQIDFSELEEKYMPLVEAAEKEQNPAKFYEAMSMFGSEFHDGHVSVIGEYDQKTYQPTFMPKEYGLAMVKLDNGDVIAVCTMAEVQSLGITDGTVITKWNGKPVLQAAAEDVKDLGLPVKDNADRLAVMNLSSVGGDTIEVTFIDKSGNEKTVTLSALEKLQTFREAEQLFSKMPVIETEEEIETFMDKNFSTKMLNDKCGYLILNAEGTDSGFEDMMGYLTGNHSWAREMFREKLRDLKSQGMEYLVIDLRNNVGGLDEIGCALTDLLTTDDWFAQGLGIRRNGKNICVSAHSVNGDGEFADLQVVALTNYNCGSAGDGAALYLSRLANVTLAGITDPNGCNQESGGSAVLSEGHVIVMYPVGLILDENGNPNIDTAPDRISRNPVEVRIPFDYDAAMRIFCDKEDYELEWAVKYLEEHT